MSLDINLMCHEMCQPLHVGWRWQHLGFAKKRSQTHFLFEVLISNLTVQFDSSELKDVAGLDCVWCFNLTGDSFAFDF